MRLPDATLLQSGKYVPLVCEWCGSVKVVDKRLVKRRRFCSTSCAAQYGNSLRPSAKHRSTLCEKARKIHFERNGKDKCIFCGTDKRLEVHHKDGNRHNNKAGNLVAMCKSCHMTFHNFVRGILNASSPDKTN